MPFLAGDIEARASVLECLEIERLPASLDQSLRDLKMPVLAREMEARGSGKW
jgi:hypothetical protein